MTKKEMCLMLNKIVFEFGSANYSEHIQHTESKKSHVDTARTLVSLAREMGMDITIHRTNDGKYYAAIETIIDNKKVFEWITSCDVNADHETYEIMQSKINDFKAVDVKCYYVMHTDTKDGRKYSLHEYE